MTGSPAVVPFEHRLVVRFGECDPAGVVYYPRYFDWFHRTMEAWFGEGLAHPYHEVLRELGFPSVHAEADYKAPCRMGEALTVALVVERLGRASVTLGLRVLGPDGGLRATGRVVIVTIRMAPGQDEHFSLRALPPALRDAMARYAVEGADA
ncbi:MAG: acyl-CoA thioesterase [Alphaproteobacteria bacterium]|nr:acyl-CoA thioesterase [Alphaproteobacteria bacterium]